MVKSIKNQFTFEDISSKKSVDLQVIMLVVLLAGIGAVSLFSASWYFSVKVDKGPFYFFVRHLQFLGLGVVLALIITFINIEVFEKLASVVLLISIVLNVLVFIPAIGRTISGGTRWFEIAGIKFQPSELMKITITIYLAHMFDKKRAMINDIPRTIIPALIVVGTSAFIIIMQNDFSTSFFVFILSLGILFISGVKKRFIAIITGFCLLIGVFVVSIQPYRIRRIVSWLNPEKDPLASGYQVLTSLKALYQGGLTGKGIGAGDIKLGPLPQAHSDFVFTVVGEESGLVGVMLIIILFVVFLLKGLSIASRQKRKFNLIVVAGFTCAIFFQAMLNMGVVSGLFPPTGIPLPFFSQGGTSILVTMIMVGFILNLSRIKEDEEVNDEQ